MRLITPKRLKAKTVRGAEVPDTDLTERHEPSKHAAHEDAYVAIRDAFSAAGRKLQDYAKRQSGAVKAHEPTTLTARVTRLFPEERYGFIETPDGREIYFHGNSVLQLVGCAQFKVDEDDRPPRSGPGAMLVHSVSIG